MEKEVDKHIGFLQRQMDSAKLLQEFLKTATPKVEHRDGSDYM